jgi:hypothetical protein
VFLALREKVVVSVRRSKKERRRIRKGKRRWEEEGRTVDEERLDVTLKVLLADDLPSIRQREPRLFTSQQVPVLYRQRRTSNNERLPLPLLPLLDLFPSCR